MTSLPIVAIVLVAAGALPPAQAASSDRPITLVAKNLGSGVQLEVVGESSTATEASYALDVSGGSAAGRNHSLQRGRAVLRPGVAATLVTLTLGASSGGWSASLHVQPKGRPSYDINRHSNE